MDKKNDMMQLLPDDALASILARLAPRCLAVSRRVCRAWRAVVDAHRLLRTDLLPLSFGGVYLGVSYRGYFPPLFSHPSTGPAMIHDDLDYLCTDDESAWTIQDHCNGLLLFPGHVVNPATRQCARLPLHVPWLTSDLYHKMYLVYDPFVSPHYEVFSIPAVSYEQGSEWPPSPYVMHVFSSRTWQWEERPFIREGPARGADAVAYKHANRYGVYWREALYVQCDDNFVIRINLSAGKYHLIEPPELGPHTGYGILHLGKSEMGVYYAPSIPNGCRLRVWFLDESCGRLEWVLKWDNDLKPRMPCPNYDDHSSGSWLLQCYNEDKYYGEDTCDSPPYEEGSEWTNYDNDDVVSNGSMPDYTIDYEEEAHVANRLTWSFGYENVASPEYWEVDMRDAYDDDGMQVPKETFEWCFDDHGDNVCYNESYGGSLHFLGFHPYKEIIFINDTYTRVLACHLDTSKIEDLGSLARDGWLQPIHTSFAYTPCWMREGMVSKEQLI